MIPTSWEAVYRARKPPHETYDTRLIICVREFRNLVIPTPRQAVVRSIWPGVRSRSITPCGQHSLQIDCLISKWSWLKRWRSPPVVASCVDMCVSLGGWHLCLQQLACEVAIVNHTRSYAFSAFSVLNNLQLYFSLIGTSLSSQDKILCLSALERR